jgi:quinoprotein glucose dehydrogenase
MSDRMILVAGRAAASFVAVMFAVVLVAMVHAWPEAEPAPIAADIPSLAPAPTDGDWLHYGRDAGGTRFSPLAQITPDNVHKLKVAWIARTGPSPAGDGRRGNFEATPLKVGESLYVCTGDNVVLALDAATGRTRWKFDPRIEAGRLPPFRSCRGVAYARTSDVAGLCAERIFTGTLDAALWALDSASGKPCPDFGVGGRVDLLRGMSPAEPGYYYVTSVRRSYAEGRRGRMDQRQPVNEGPPASSARSTLDQASLRGLGCGSSRASRRAARRPELWFRNAQQLGADEPDESAGLVFVLTGNATPDFVGMHRSPGSHRFDRRWSRSMPRPISRWSFRPCITMCGTTTSPRSRRSSTCGSRPLSPALIQPTKTAQLFLLDRRDGSPVARVEDVTFPREQFRASGCRKRNLLRRHAVARRFNLAQIADVGCHSVRPALVPDSFASLRYDGEFTPPSVQDAEVSRICRRNELGQCLGRP